MKSGIELIAEERQRQISEEGWTPEHDDHHADGELADATSCYALTRGRTSYNAGVRIEIFRSSRWPFSSFWKPRKHEGFYTPEERIKELVKAGALVAAEIDRFQRLRMKEAP